MTLTGIGCSVTSLSIMKMKLDKARDWLRDAEAVLITAGAGMGVDSGLPDFRGNQGFWNAYPAYKRLGFNFVEMASPDRFRDAPELGWGFYGHRLDLYQKTIPHAGFAKLLSYAESKPHGYGVFTSNVDGQFQMAGFSEEHIVERHGSIHHLQCLEGCTEAIWALGDIRVEVCADTMRAQAPLPACRSCGGLARPNILMFGDWNWIAQRTIEQEKRFHQWMNGLLEVPVVVVEFGAGTSVLTVRRFSEHTASSLSAPLVRVNPREPEVLSLGVGLPYGALEAVDRLLN